MGSFLPLIEGNVIRLCRPVMFAASTRDNSVKALYGELVIGSKKSGQSKRFKSLLSRHYLRNKAAAAPLPFAYELRSVSMPAELLRQCGLTEPLGAAWGIWREWKRSSTTLG